MTRAPGHPAVTHGGATLRITQEAEGSGWTLKLDGELDMASAPALSTVVSSLAPDATKVILDMSNLSFMDSSGLALILRLRRVCRRNDCGLLLLSPHPCVLHLLDVSGLRAPMRELGLLAE
ncbi:MAG TPA: STAS domain-containing protein [Solirubrobacteraceae bacterium]|nr:STAS domain-containing protein [Solirubrobacteraceae bacterium]